jgi:hypothetical protein
MPHQQVAKALTDLLGPDKGDAKALRKQKLKEERKAAKKKNPEDAEAANDVTQSPSAEVPATAATGR